jgi:hypothetical protein
VKCLDPVQRGQKLLNTLPLHSNSSSVNEAHLTKSTLSRGRQILERNVPNLCRTKGMQVEDVCDRDLNRVVLHPQDSMRYSPDNSRSDPWSFLTTLPAR